MTSETQGPDTRTRSSRRVCPAAVPRRLPHAKRGPGLRVAAARAGLRSQTRSGAVGSGGGFDWGVAALSDGWRRAGVEAPGTDAKRWAPLAHPKRFFRRPRSGGSLEAPRVDPAAGRPCRIGGCEQPAWRGGRRCLACPD